MTQTVSSLTLICLTVSCLWGFAIPAYLYVNIKRKTNADTLPFFVGCAVMFLFAFVLESGVHTIVLGSGIGQKIQGSTLLYALYGGLMAGLFEETGRFAAFKTVLSKKMDKDANALMYGGGHGGLEAMMILGFSMLNNLVMAMMINNGRISEMTASLSPAGAAEMNAAVAALTQTPSYMFLIGILERVFAVVIQISLSVLVWFAVKNKNRRYLFSAAVAVHFAVDALTVLLSGRMPALALEAVVGLLAVAAALFARKIWKEETAA